MEGITMPGITILGLGPGNPLHLTREAWNVLSSAEEVWLRTRQHPTVPSLPEAVTLHSFDDLYENGDSFEKVYQAIVQKVLELGRRQQGVIYAVPGHPFVVRKSSASHKPKGFISSSLMGFHSWNQPSLRCILIRIQK